MHKETLTKINTIPTLIEMHIQAGKDLFTADQRLYSTDLLVFAVMHRSMMLLSGFKSLMEQENFVAGAPLIRFQIDNCLRFFGCNLVNNCDEFAHSILAGKRINDIKDRDGKRLTDNYLLEKFSAYYPWFKKVYEGTSGYVHLSNKHIFAALKVHPENPTFNFRLMREPTDSYIPDEIFEEAVQAMFAITEVFLELIYSWIDHKKALPGKSDIGLSGDSDLS